MMPVDERRVLTLVTLLTDAVGLSTEPRAVARIASRYSQKQGSVPQCGTNDRCVP